MATQPVFGWIGSREIANHPITNHPITNRPIADGLGATIDFGSEDCNRELHQFAALLARAHGRGLATVCGVISAARGSSSPKRSTT